MTSSASRSVAVLLLSLACLASAPPPRPSRIVAIADVHGNLDGLKRILYRAHVTDARGMWTGGNAVLVQTGDVTDRGHDVRAVMDLLMTLQQQAREAGGAVHVLLGNHEALNLLSQFRDVSPGAFAKFADASSERRRLDEYEAYVAVAAARGKLFERVPELYQPPPRNEWLAKHPPGFVEYAEALGPAGHYGKWLRSLPVVVKVGDTIFLHAGINPSRAPESLDLINEGVRDEVERFDRLRRELLERGWITPTFQLQQIVEAATYARTADPQNAAWEPRATPANTWALIDPEGPLWYRGFAEEDPAAESAIIEMLKKYSAARFVAGHTPVATRRIQTRFSRRVYLIDTGMLVEHYRGRASALEIRDGRITAIYEDGVLLVP